MVAAMRHVRVLLAAAVFGMLAWGAMHALIAVLGWIGIVG